MALPVESATVEDLVAERAERRAAVARLPATSSAQSFLKDVAGAFTEVRELAEDILLADRATLTASTKDNPATTVRLISAKRRLVELAIRYSWRLQLATSEGLEVAGKSFPQQLTVAGSGVAEKETTAVQQVNSRQRI
jgi:hypothetical protein